MEKKLMPEEVKKVFDDLAHEEEEIVKNAKAAGKWAPGLDSNKELFEEAHARAREKLAELAKKYNYDSDNNNR